MKTNFAYNIQIFCGLKEGYDGKVHDVEQVEILMQKFVDENKDCVTITPTKFLYVGGSEPGVIVGLISYPRFIRSTTVLKNRAIEIAKILMVAFKQNRITITTPEESIMLEEEDVKKTIYKNICHRRVIVEKYNSVKKNENTFQENFQSFCS